MKVKRKTDEARYLAFNSVPVGAVVEFKSNPGKLYIKTPFCRAYNGSATVYNLLEPDGYFAYAKDSDLCIVVKCTLVED